MAFAAALLGLLLTRERPEALHPVMNSFGHPHRLAIAEANGACALLPAQDWPTVHKDARRSGFSGTVPSGPYERKWYRDFHEEMIASRVEAVVAEGKVFVGTFAGRVHALDVADGRTAWTFQSGGPIGHSPLYLDGRVYAASDDGRLYCLQASDGRRLWSYPAGAGIWVAPATDGTRVYAGDRAGVFHAVDARTGAKAWTFPTGGMILKPASVAEDGPVVFASEDMHVYALSPDGRLLWRSAKMQGVTTRDHAPTLWRGLAIVRTSPADGFHAVMDRNQAFLADVQKRTPIGPDDRVIDDKHGAYILRYTEARHSAEQEAVAGHLRENPHDRTFYAFRLEDGAEPWIAPVLYTGGLHNPATPPTFDPKTGDLYTFYRSSVTNWSRGVRPFTAVGRLDRGTGRIESVRHAHGDEPGWSAFASIGDEAQALSLMGDVLLSTHQGTLGGLRLHERTWWPICQARDTYGGIFGPGALPGGWEAEKKAQREGLLVNMPNEWHGPDKSIVAIAENRFFWVTGSQVVCWGGPDVPRAASGGAKPPPVIKRRFERVVVVGGNVTADRIGGYDAQVPRADVARADVAWILDDPPAPPAGSPVLDAAAMEVVEGPWAPFIVQLGISKEERHFARTAETMRALALALPRLSPDVRAKVKGHLDVLFEAGAPLDRVWHEAEARRRELYDLGPGMKAFAAATPREGPRIEDLYALWAYAHHAAAWERVLARKDAIRALFPPERTPFEHGSKKARADRLNAEIAGTIGFARLMKKAGETADVERALERLAALVADRVHHERADTAFVRAPRDAHSGSIPRYEEMTSELAAMLGRLAKDALAANLRDLTTQLPVWYQAFAERLIGGENYTHTPRLAWGLFLTISSADLGSPPLDHPWCRADLYRLEKLVVKP